MIFPEMAMRNLLHFHSIICVFFAATACFALDEAVDAIHADFLWQQGYSGQGVEIGVIDLFMADSAHPAIHGNFLGSQKFVNGAAWLDSHATAVAGAALSQDATRRGVAFSAGWWTAQTTNRGSISNPRTQTIAAETFARGLGNLNGNPAEVLTLSIGFDGDDAANDQWSLGLDHLVSTWGRTICVAAGNDGPAGGTLSGPPVAAFNILSVGATGGSGGAVSRDYSQIAPYSSRGPTAGGRSKPDLVAPGSLIELPTLSNAWSVASGTSFATPLVAGGAALLVGMGRDRALDTDALVIKSVLMNSADKLPGWSHTPAAPLDVAFGAGQMNLEAAYYQYDAGEQGPGSVGSIGWDHGTILGATDNVYNLDPQLPAGSVLTATLAWNRQVSSSTNDIETTIYTASPLANLDLLLYDDANPMSPTASSVSTVDNVEHLFLSVPSGGHYSLAVRSANALVDPLAYSLAWNIVVPKVVLPGDYNDDGVVDAADYVAWRDNVGAAAGTLPNDMAGGAIGTAQYDQWRAHVGQIAGSGTGSISEFAIAEPVTVVLLLPATVVVLARRYRGAERR